MYVPSIKKNLIYVFAITDNDMKFKFDKYKCHVKDVQDHYKVLAIRSRLGGLYTLDAIKGNHQALAASVILDVELWHQRYGHLNHNNLILLKKIRWLRVFLSLKMIILNVLHVHLENNTKMNFLTMKRQKYTELLELIHTDVCGPMQTRALGGAWYFLYFFMIDPCSHGLTS